MKVFGKLLLILSLSTGLSSVAAAQDGSYVSALGGLSIRSDSSNAGELTSAFTTGAGTTIPAGTLLPSGTSLGWETDFETGYNLAFAYGYRFPNGLRPEFEFGYLKNDIGSHADVTVGGGPIGTEDAGVLVTGSGNLGVSVANLVADGQGNSDTWAFMGNTYYDFNAGGMLNPYVGFGLGYANTDVTFEPSGVAIADENDGAFAYQGMIGLDFTVDDAVSLFTEYRYFATDDARIELSLLPGFLEVENRSNLVNFGVKFRF